MTTDLLFYGIIHTKMIRVLNNRVKTEVEKQQLDHISNNLRNTNIMVDGVGSLLRL